MSSELFGPKRLPQDEVDNKLEIRRLRDIQKALQAALRKLRAEHSKELADRSAEHRKEVEGMRAQFLEELTSSQAAEHRAREWLRVLGVEASALAPEEAAAAGPPRSPSPPRAPSPPTDGQADDDDSDDDAEYVRSVRARLGPDYMTGPARMPGREYSPPRSPPSPPQYSPPRSPRAAAGGAAGGAPGGFGARTLANAPKSLEELDATALAMLHSSAHNLLAQVELAQDRQDVWENVAQEFPDFRCSISHQLMLQPVVCDDGTSYDRKAILEWFAQQTRRSEPLTSPLTRERVSSKVVSNLVLKNLINSAVEAKLAKLSKGKRKRDD